MSLLIKQVRILDMAGEGEVKGDILIEGDRIAAIGPKLAAKRADTIDGNGMAAMPGLINAHQHSPMSLLRCFSDDLKLMDWLERKMLPAESRMTPEDLYYGAMLSMAEMIRGGTTAFADMYMNMDVIARAVQETGMRASLARGLVFKDDDGGKRMREALDLVSDWEGKAEGRITTMLGPHSPYLCPPEPLREVIGIAGTMKIPVHIHLAETKEEVIWIRDRYGMTPAEYLWHHGLFERCHVLLAHAVHLNRRDIGYLRGMRGGVSHNPVSNLKLGCGIAPIEEMREAGITVGLGTDGAGSAATLDMFQEIRAAAWLQKADYGDPSRVPALQALRMATTESAKLLGLGEGIGTLRAGGKADIILVDFNKPHLQPVHHTASLLAYSAAGSDVDTVIVNGKVLMRRRQLLTIDEERVMYEAGKRAARIVQGL